MATIENLGTLGRLIRYCRAFSGWPGQIKHIYIKHHSNHRYRLIRYCRAFSGWPGQIKHNRYIKHHSNHRYRLIRYCRAFSGWPGQIKHNRYIKHHSNHILNTKKITWSQNITITDEIKYLTT